jgi:hypothetical protein
MKRIREHSKMIVIFLLTAGIAIESSAVSSGKMFGQFSSNASAAYYRDNASSKVEMAAFPGFLLAAAEAIGAAYAAGYIVGRLAYAVLGETHLIDDQSKDRNYDRLAFAQFDN